MVWPELECSLFGSMISGTKISRWIPELQILDGPISQPYAYVFMVLVLMSYFGVVNIATWLSLVLLFRWIWTYFHRGSIFFRAFGKQGVINSADWSTLMRTRGNRKSIEGILHPPCIRPVPVPRNVWCASPYPASSLISDMIEFILRQQKQIEIFEKYCCH